MNNTTEPITTDLTFSQQNIENNTTPLVETSLVENNATPLVETLLVDNNTTPLVETLLVNNNTTPLVETSLVDNNTTPLVETPLVENNTTPLVETFVENNTIPLVENNIDSLSNSSFLHDIKPSRLGRVYHSKIFKPKEKSLLKKTFHLTKKLRLPRYFFLSVPFTPYDQGSIGSCTANALCASIRLQYRTTFNPSRLFLYYATRDMENSLDQEGAYLDDCYTILKNTGICKETTWPYIIEKANIRPPSRAYREAKQKKIKSWWSISLDSQLISNIKQVLYAQKVVVIGILVYESFENNSVNNNGMIPIPDTQQESLLGGHAISLVGFDDRKSAFLAMNSWGSSWGVANPRNNRSKGFCYIPYDYINNPTLCDECLFFDKVVSNQSVSNNSSTSTFRSSYYQTKNAKTSLGFIM